MVHGDVTAREGCSESWGGWKSFGDSTGGPPRVEGVSKGGR